MGIADGLCVIEIGLPAFGVSDEASGFDIAHAAWMIINTCVADFKHEGGRMDGVGMLVSFAPFSPAISHLRTIFHKIAFPVPLPSPL